MSRLRQDPLTGRWVIIAAGREARPNEFPLQVRATDGSESCPFCPGHEDQTTPEIMALGRPPEAAPNSPGWRLRIFPNMYPALRDPATSAGDDLGRDGGLQRQAAGHGRHEVVVYSPDHAAGLADLPPPRLTELFSILQDRIRDIFATPGVRFVAPFCNHGPEAGATLAHPHLQIIGAGQVPLLTVEKVVRSVDHWRRQGRCLLCDLLAQETEEDERVVAASGYWTVLTPWASRFPWEMLVVPHRHAAGLVDASDEELADLGHVLGRALRVLAAVHGDLSLNLVVHDAPRPAGPDAGFADDRLDPRAADLPAAFHWHLEILPRLSRQAGFEAGTGYAINSVEPEAAAHRLRQEGSSA